MENEVLSAQDIRDYRFNTTPFARSYKINEVDDFLDRVAEVIDAYERGTKPSLTLSSAEVLAHDFKTTRFMEGYSIDGVDDLLTQVTGTLRYWEQGGATAGVSAEGDVHSTTAPAHPKVSDSTTPFG